LLVSPGDFLDVPHSIELNLLDQHIYAPD